VDGGGETGAGLSEMLKAAQQTQAALGECECMVMVVSEQLGASADM